MTDLFGPTSDAVAVAGHAAAARRGGRVRAATGKAISGRAAGDPEAVGIGRVEAEAADVAQRSQGELHLGKERVILGAVAACDQGTLEAAEVREPSTDRLTNVEALGAGERMDVGHAADATRPVHTGESVSVERLNNEQPATTGQPRSRIPGYAYVHVRVERRRPIVSWRLADAAAYEARHELPLMVGDEWDDERLRAAAVAYLQLDEADGSGVELGQR